jgi:hypothetical protein
MIASDVPAHPNPPDSRQALPALARRAEQERDIHADVEPFVLHLYAALAEKAGDVFGPHHGGAGGRQGARDQARQTRLAEARAATDAASREAADRHAALVLPAILPLREQGMTSREIATELRERGVPTGRSGKWAPRRSSTSSDAEPLDLSPPLVAV